MDTIFFNVNSVDRSDLALISAPELGQLCCTPYSADGGWYRAEILMVNSEEGKAGVRYIDYGQNESTVKGV